MPKIILIGGLLQNLFYSIVLLCFFFQTLAGCATAPGTKPAKHLAARDSVKELTGRFISNILIEETGGSSVMKIAATGPFKYISYMLDKHRRLVLEIEGADNALSSKLIPGNGDLIDHIAIDDSKPGIVKVESTLKRPCGYDIKMDGAVLSVAFTPKADASSAPKPRPMEKKEQDEMEIDRLKAEVAFLRSRNSDLEDKLRQWKEKSDNATVSSSTPSGAGHVDGALESTIESWRLAWQDKDVERYGDFYSESFTQDGQDKKAWLLSKKEKFERAEGISIKTENIQADISGNQASVKFIQDYQSGRHKDRGIKTLFMTQTSEGWKILSEKWEALK